MAHNMAWENKADRDILIETATELRELRRVLEEDSTRRDRVQRDHDIRIRRLEELRWAIYGAWVAAAAAGAQAVRSFLGIGRH